MINENTLVLIAPDLYAIDQLTANLIKEAKEKKLPAGYAWATDEMIHSLSSKDGQARTGDVVSRVKAFATTGRQIVLDVIIDDFFTEPGQDQVLNDWRNENETGVKLDKGIRTKEGMKYKDEQAFSELKIRRIEALKAVTKDPFAGAIECFLNTTQFNQLATAIKLYRNGSRKILADLCARFGKTIWSAAIGRLLGVDVIIVSAYVKTVFASFGSDLIKYKQFSDFVHIKMEDPEYSTKITKALSSDKKVIAYLSLCQGSERDNRIAFLGKLKYSKFWIIDEADYGAHQPKQVKPIKNAVGDDYLLIMTGTNADRAVNHWEEVFETIGTTYLELLIQKEETQKELLNV
jgi:hypothetical protein